MQFMRYSVILNPKWIKIFPKTNPYDLFSNVYEDSDEEEDKDKEDEHMV